MNAKARRSGRMKSKGSECFQKKEVASVVQYLSHCVVHGKHEMNETPR